MKIAIIGVARSKTTVLMESLRKQHPHLTCWYEIYTYRLGKETINDISNDLHQKDDFIVKIMCHNIFNREDKINDFKLETYDEIYIIERPDFFNQCCSFEIAQSSNIWHQRGNIPLYEKVKNKTYKLQNDSILYQAKGVDTFIKLKKYLINNNISFINYNYYDSFDNVPKTLLQKSNLDYSNLIENYHLKDKIQSLFKSYFNYDTLQSDYENFRNQLLVEVAGTI